MKTFINIETAKAYFDELVASRAIYNYGFIKNDDGHVDVYVQPTADIKAEYTPILILGD